VVLRGTAALPDGTAMPHATRLRLIAEHDPQSAALLLRLLRIAVRVLPQAVTAGKFARTLSGTRMADRAWQLRPLGTSAHEGAIAALGLLRLPEQRRRSVLGGEDCGDLIGRLAAGVERMTSRGDVALLCWAAAEAGHGDLPCALGRLAELDLRDDPLDVAAAAWIVTALVAARPLADVERHLTAARHRLLAARDALYPQVIGAATATHDSGVGSFADQAYSVQALSRLHRSADDPEALAAAESVAATICRTQGKAGQWWCHHDARTGGIVDGYPVYGVHQHALAPMALLDLADAGGQLHLEAICRGLRWLARPPETTESLLLDEPPVTWRKVALRDRGNQAAEPAAQPPGSARGLGRERSTGSSGRAPSSTSAGRASSGGCCSHGCRNWPRCPRGRPCQHARCQTCRPRRDRGRCGNIRCQACRSTPDSRPCQTCRPPRGSGPCGGDIRCRVCPQLPGSQPCRHARCRICRCGGIAMSPDAAGLTRRNLFGIGVHALTMTQAVGRCTDAVEHGRFLSVGMVNAAKVAVMHRDERLRQAVAGSAMVLADGQSVVWASRMLGSPVPERVAGIDLFVELLGEADRHAYRVYFLGARRDVLDRMLAEIGRKYPGLAGGGRPGWLLPARARGERV